MRLGRLLCFLLLCALLAPAAASARPLVGIGDQHAASYQDAGMRKLPLGTARLALAWDWHKDPYAVAQADAWVAAVKAARLRPLITFNRNWSPSGKRQVPPVKQYLRSFRLLRARYPHVREFSPWNEPNAAEQPFARKPALAARYFNAMRKACRGCTVLAGDVKDGTGMVPWLSVYKRHVRGAKVWALHNYKDATRSRGGTKDFLRTVRGPVWLDRDRRPAQPWRPARAGEGRAAGVRHRPVVAAHQAGLLLPVAARPQPALGLGLRVGERQAPARLPRPARRAQPLDAAQARVRAVLAPDLPARAAVDHHDVGREVVRAADQRGADAVGVDRHAVGLERADALGGEAAGDDDLDVAVAVRVELGADELARARR